MQFLPERYARLKAAQTEAWKESCKKKLLCYYSPKDSPKIPLIKSCITDPFPRMPGRRSKTEICGNHCGLCSWHLGVAILAAILLLRKRSI